MLQISYSTRYILWCLDFPYEFFFANKYDYTIKKEWRGEQTSFRLKKKIVVLICPKRNLGRTMLKFDWFQI